jgi:pimeloyl-ACP methyl ester carboxylesterase
MAEDCIELCRWLGGRFPNRRLVLLSSSAGTLVALPVVARHPELFSAYVATDLNAGIASERAAGPLTEAWTRRHAPRELPFLASLGPDPTAWSPAQFDRLMRLRDRSAGPHGVGAAFTSRFGSPLHSPRDMLLLARGTSLSSQALFPSLARFDASCFGALALPVLVFQGEHDRFTPPEPARAWCDRLDAPHRHFELLPGVGHLGAFVRPEPFLDRLLPALARADAAATRAEA